MGTQIPLACDIIHVFLDLLDVSTPVSSDFTVTLSLLGVIMNEKRNMTHRREQQSHSQTTNTSWYFAYTCSRYIWLFLWSTTLTWWICMSHSNEAEERWWIWGQALTLACMYLEVNRSMYGDCIRRGGGNSLCAQCWLTSYCVLGQDTSPQISLTAHYGHPFFTYYI